MEITAAFKMTFLATLALTIISLLGVALLAAFGANAIDAKQVPYMQQQLYSMCSFGWQSGLGAIFGLLGGKATDAPYGNRNKNQVQKPRAVARPHRAQ